MEFTRDIQCTKMYCLKHFTQSFEWDCGITCIKMILPENKQIKYFKNFPINEFSKDYNWTIDLCYLLKKLDIKHIYLTKTLGIDANYKSHPYYKNTISKNENRILKRFKEAENHSIIIKRCSVSLNFFVEHLANDGPIIILTNVSALTCDICRPLNSASHQRYKGHYIVVCGYDLIGDKILYLNPIHDNHVCRTSFSLFDSARIAFGTDEDAILLYKS